IPSKSRETTRGAVYWKATLFPVERPITSTMVCGSRPAFAPRTSASMTAIRPTWASILLTSFITSPWPTGPRWMTSAAMASRTGWAFSIAGAWPPTNAFNVPSFAPCSMPLTGASIRSTPRAASFVHLLHCRGVDGAHADHDIAGLRSLDKAAGADNDLFSLRGGVDHRDDPLRARRDIGRTRPDLCTERGNSRVFLVIDVVSHQRVPGLQNVRGHRAPHHSEANKSDGFFSGVPAQGTLLRWSVVSSPSPRSDMLAA